jgi:MinD-like ATPase involved in chromosome partitioning or flagellar assembly
VWITSGSGGSGRSTIAHNLALALSRLGTRVGLVDHDVAFVKESAWSSVRGGGVWAFDGRSMDALAIGAGRRSGGPRQVWIFDSDLEGAIRGLIAAPRKAVWLVLTTPDPSASAGAYLVADILARERQESFALLTNRAASPRHGRLVNDRICRMLHERSSSQPIFREWVTDDAALTASVRRLEPLLSRPPFTPAGNDLARVARKLLSLAGPTGR